MKLPQPDFFREVKIVPNRNNWSNKDRGLILSLDLRYSSWINVTFITETNYIKLYYSDRHYAMVLLRDLWTHINKLKNRSVRTSARLKNSQPFLNNWFNVIFFLKTFIKKDSKLSKIIKYKYQRKKIYKYPDVTEIKIFFLKFLCIHRG